MKPIHAFMGLMLLAPAHATLAAESAPCCASGDNGKPRGFTARTYTDLGQTNPSVANVSLLPEYQVYQFTRGGVRYTEVADASGTPRAAFTAIGGSLLVLPVGQDAVQQVAIAASPADVVYEDGTFIVSKRVGADGVLSWQVYLK